MTFTYVPIVLTHSMDSTKFTPPFSIAINIPMFCSLINDPEYISKIVYFPARSLRLHTYVYARLVFIISNVHAIYFPVRLCINRNQSPSTMDFFHPALAAHAPNNETPRSVISRNILTSEKILPLSIIRPPATILHSQSIPITPTHSIPTFPFISRPTFVYHSILYQSVRKYVPLTLNHPAYKFIIDKLSARQVTSILSSNVPLLTTIPELEPSQNEIKSFFISSWTPEDISRIPDIDPEYFSSHLDVSVYIDDHISSRHHDLLTIHPQPVTPRIPITFGELPPDPVNPAFIYYEYMTVNTSISGIPTSGIIPSSPSSANSTPSTMHLQSPALSLSSLRPPPITMPLTSIDILLSSVNNETLKKMILSSAIPPQSQSSDMSYSDILDPVSIALTSDSINLANTAPITFATYVLPPLRRAIQTLDENPTTRDFSSILRSPPSALLNEVPPEECFARSVVFHLGNQLTDAFFRQYHHCSCGLLCPLNWQSPLLRSTPLHLLASTITENSHTFTRDKYFT